jgi:L,D-transpeptidase catalytic domain
MKTLSKLVSTSSVSLLVITSPVLISGSHKKISEESLFNTKTVSAPYYSRLVTDNKVFNYNATSTSAAVKALVVNTTATSDNNNNYASDVAARKAFEVKMVIHEAEGIYDSMNLEKKGLNEKAFEYAWRGYHNLLKKGVLNKTNVLSICDFTQSSRKKRMYVIDVQHRKLLFNTYVAHGMNSGVEYATTFSNRPESFKSSLGFYLTTKTYFGRNGLSLKINGLEKGYNDMAARRNIVLHGSTYIEPDYLKNNGEMGRSLGCAALPTAVTPKIIKSIKNGSCLFIYHPTRKYLADSNVING